MVAVAGRLALYLPVFAVWMVLVGAIVNRDRALIVVPVAVGAVAGVVGAIMGIVWLLIPVALTWVWGVSWMVVDQRRRKAVSPGRR